MLHCYMKDQDSTPKTERGVRKIPMTDQVYRAFVEQKKLRSRYGCESTPDNHGAF